MLEFNYRGASALIVLGAFSSACEEKPAPEVTQPPAVQEVKKEPPLEKVEENSGPPPWSDRLTKDSGFPCDVEKVLAATCRRCHWEPQENDAPFAMVRWEDTREERQGSEIWELMKKQVAADLMPPLDVIVDPPVTPLTPEQKSTLLAWLDAGAEKSTDTCE